MRPAPSFDTWTSGFLFAVAMGIFLFLILIFSKTKRNYPIALLVLSFSGTLFSYVMFWTKYSYEFPYFNTFQFIGFYASGPLLYLYLQGLFEVKSKTYILHFIPCFFWVFIALLINSKHIFNHSISINEVFNYFSHYMLIILHLSIYLALSIILIRKYRQIETEEQRIRQKWVKTLLSLFAFFVLCYTSYFILVNFSFFNNQWDYMISIAMSITIYAIGYFVYMEPQIFNGEFFSGLFLPIENKDDSLEDHLIKELYNNLVVHIETKKPFIDNELRLAQLADQMGYSTHLLSKVINKKSGKNFNNFINDYRLLAAEKLLKSANNYSIKTIYFDVGFNNKVTFYKAFKDKHGCTPTEYKSVNN